MLKAIEKNKWMNNNYYVLRDGLEFIGGIKISNKMSNEKITLYFNYYYTNIPTLNSIKKSVRKILQEKSCNYFV